MNAFKRTIRMNVSEFVLSTLTSSMPSSPFNLYTFEFSYYRPHSFFLGLKFDFGMSINLNGRTSKLIAPPFWIEEALYRSLLNFKCIQITEEHKMNTSDLEYRSTKQLLKNFHWRILDVSISLLYGKCRKKNINNVWLYRLIIRYLSHQYTYLNTETSKSVLIIFETDKQIAYNYC